VGNDRPQALGVCGAPPSAATFRRVLAAVDIAAVEAALTGWVTGRQARAQAARPTGTTVAEGRTVVAVDGKTLRGSKDADSQQTKLVSVYDHAHQLVLTQTAVAAGDEVAAFTAALATLPNLSNVLVTADALHCQRAHADFLAARGGHYLFTVKSNQPLLRQALMRLPGPRRPAPDAAGEAMAAASPARSRSSTWMAPPPTACSRTAAGRSRSSDGAASVVAGPRSRSSTRSPRWTTAPPTRGCWPSGCKDTGRSRTASTTSAT